MLLVNFQSSLYIRGLTSVSDQFDGGANNAGRTTYMERAEGGFNDYGAAEVGRGGSSEVLLEQHPFLLLNAARFQGWATRTITWVYPVARGGWTTTAVQETAVEVSMWEAARRQPGLATGQEEATSRRLGWTTTAVLKILAEDLMLEAVVASSGVLA